MVRLSLQLQLLVLAAAAQATALAISGILQLFVARLNAVLLARGLCL